MSYDPRQVIFLDTETSGLDDLRHEVWEIGIIRDDVEHHFMLRINQAQADPFSLTVGGYHERHPDGLVESKAAKPTACTKPDIVARKVARLIHGRHIVGAVPDFDYRFLRKLLRSHGLAWTAHYHLIDIEALMVGYLCGGTEHTGGTIPVSLPWRSKELSRAVGVDPGLYEAHTALGDARWAKAVFEVVMGKPEIPGVMP